jgi:hypothetical protein
MRLVTMLIGMGIMLGAGAGAVARGGAVVRQPIAAAAPQVSSENDGLAPLVTIDLEPSAVLQGPSGDGLEFQLSLKSRSQRSLVLRYSYELVDDRGNSRQKPVMSSLTAVSATGIHGVQLATPVGLTDGYYQARVTAAAADGVEDTLQVAERYFVVNHGAVTPLSSDRTVARRAVDRVAADGESFSACGNGTIGLRAASARILQSRNRSTASMLREWRGRREDLPGQRPVRPVHRARRATPVERDGIRDRGVLSEPGQLLPQHAVVHRRDVRAESVSDRHANR